MITKAQFYILGKEKDTYKLQEITTREPLKQTLSLETSNLRIVRFINGWHKTGTPSVMACGQITCNIEPGSNSTSGADVLVFNDQDVQHFETPPHKRVNDLWVFSSLEPPNHILTEHQFEWDGFFNYSTTYVRETKRTLHSFRSELGKKRQPTKINFASQRKRILPRALWIVSHCTQKDRYQVLSGRAEYIQELSKHFRIDIYSPAEACKNQFGSLVLDNRTQVAPKIGAYMFYLAFENNLCRDYISEKLWKVLNANVPTIPVVLGGLSIEEYKHVAPPNSYIHVKNFTSPEALAQHLKYVSTDDTAYTYYMQWRNTFSLYNHNTFKSKLRSQYI